MIRSSGDEDDEERRVRRRRRRQDDNTASIFVGGLPRYVKFILIAKTMTVSSSQWYSHYQLCSREIICLVVSVRLASRGYIVFWSFIRFAEILKQQDLQDVGRASPAGLPGRMSGTLLMTFSLRFIFSLAHFH